MELIILGIIVGAVGQWAFSKYIANTGTLDEALVIAEKEIKTTLDVNKDGKVNLEDAKAVVKRPRKKAGLDSTSPQ